MASSSFNSVGVTMVSSNLNLRDDNSSLISHRSEGGLHNAPETLSFSAPMNLISTTKSDHQHHDLPQSGSLPSRSSYGVGFASFAIAATTMAGLSFLSIDSFAMASEADLGKSIITTHISNPNPGRYPNPDPSFSMAIPIPHEEVWVFARNGFIAPLPNTPGHGVVTPIPQPGRAGVSSSKVSILRCPQWTPSELEMVLPDFHGRPKPFPRQGHQWPASFVVIGMPDEAFLQVSHLRDDVELDEIAPADGNAAEVAVVTANGEEVEGKLSLLKVLGVERFMCFSM